MSTSPDCSFDSLDSSSSSDVSKFDWEFRCPKHIDFCDPKVMQVDSEDIDEFFDTFSTPGTPYILRVTPARMKKTPLGLSQVRATPARTTPIIGKSARVPLVQPSPEDNGETDSSSKDSSPMKEGNEVESSDGEVYSSTISCSVRGLFADYDESEEIHRLPEEQKDNQTEALDTIEEISDCSSDKENEQPETMEGDEPVTHCPRESKAGHNGTFGMIKEQTEPAEEQKAVLNGTFDMVKEPTDSDEDSKDNRDGTFDIIQESTEDPKANLNSTFDMGKEPIDSAEEPKVDLNGTFEMLKEAIDSVQESKAYLNGTYDKGKETVVSEEDPKDDNNGTFDMIKETHDAPGEPIEAPTEIIVINEELSKRPSTEMNEIPSKEPPTELNDIQIPVPALAPSSSSTLPPLTPLLPPLPRTRPAASRCTYLSMAELSKRFERSTRVYTPPKRKPSKSPWVPTRPVSPRLTACKRKRQTNVLSSIQQEELIAKSIKKQPFKATPFNKKVFENPNIGIRRVGRKPITIPKPFTFESDKRILARKSIMPQFNH